MQICANSRKNNLFIFLDVDYAIKKNVRLVHIHYNGKKFFVSLKTQIFKNLELKMILNFIILGRCD